MNKDLLTRLDSLRDKRAKAKAEYDVAKECLAKAVAEMRELGLDTEADLDELRKMVDKKMTAFEAQIKTAEDELEGLTGG